MTPQERRVMDNLVTAVDFLLSDTPRSGRHNEVKAIRDALQQAKGNLNKSDLENDMRRVKESRARIVNEVKQMRLSTILISQRNRHGLHVVVRQQDNRSLDDQLRFMTDIENVDSDRFIQGHYLMTMDKAYEDFLERCEREECKI